jgi:hypothetical protein
MIIIKLQGGLGNQLFQWAFGKSLSIDLNTELYLDLSFLYQDIPGITKRYLELNKFPLIQEKPIDIEYNQPLYIINDNTPIENINKNSNYYLNGYFQKEKYFKHNKQIILNYLNLDSIKNNKFYEPIINCNSVSLHVRRTDYLLHQNYHPVQDIQYYNNALNHMDNYDKIFVFSDDIEWCKNNLKYDNMVFVTGHSNIEDLILMSYCKHNIIANSSFSWWSAWINQSNNKTVVAPKRWFGVQDNNSIGMIPDTWIQI